MESPTSLARRRLHKSDDDTNDGSPQEVNGITSSERQPDNSSKGEPRVQQPPGDPINPVAWLAPLFHLAMAVFYALLLHYGITLMNDNIKIIDPEGRIPAYGGRFKFLTHINQWVQLVYFAFQFFTDILPKSSFKRTAVKVSDVFFTTIAFPLSWFVVLTFWGIYAYNRNLVYPEAFDKVVPSWLNHFWHTTIGVWVLFEMLLVFHRFPSSGVAVSIHFVYNAAYIAWIGWIYTQTKFWVYPIMAVLPAPFLVLFIAGCMFFGLGIFFAGKYISYLRWGQSSVY